MFCSHCGTDNADSATVCAQCDRYLRPPTPGLYDQTVLDLPPGHTVPNYLAYAILATIFCCLPGGIVAIIYAAQVNGKLRAGNIAGAQADSKNAKLWCLISLVGIPIWVVVTIGPIRLMNH